MEKLFKLFQLL